MARGSASTWRSIVRIPDWGRLMFFRCGDLIVEVAHRPGKEADAAQDRLRGMCWRVADIDATHARLAAGGVDVSEVRTGRKPGTRVMTVRNGTCGVPTLLVQPSAGKPSCARSECARSIPQAGMVRHARSLLKPRHRVLQA